MPRATQGTSEQQLNQFNAQMRGEGWYQQWFAQHGLNPNRVKLSEQQRRDLARVAAENGYQLGDRMKIDEAGNLNQMGGYAGLPTWGKIAVGAAPIAATAGLGAAGIGPMAGLMGGGGAGVGAGGTGAGLNAAGTFAAGAGAPGAAGGLGVASGAFLPIAGAVPSASQLLGEIPSNAVGNGMGYGPADIGAGAASAGSAGLLGGLGGAAAGAMGNGVGGALGKAAGALGESATDKLLQAAMAAMAGLPGLLAANQGLSDEEKAYQAQATRLLRQQEQRTQFQNPLYEAVTKMAYNLQPIGGTGGNPYRYNTLDDVRIP